MDKNGIRTKWYWTKWYGQNGIDKMVKWYHFIFCVDFNSVEFNIAYIFSNQQSQINGKHIEES